MPKSSLLNLSEVTKDHLLASKITPHGKQLGISSTKNSKLRRTDQTFMPFGKMKTVLAGEALTPDRNIRRPDANSYKEAIKMLEDKYADKIALAISFIKEATQPTGDIVQKINQMDHALSWTIWHFKNHSRRRLSASTNSSLILMMSATMSQEMTENWTTYKENLKQQFLANERHKKTSGVPAQPWTAGMAENVATFRAWMRVFIAPHLKKDSASTSTSTVATTTNFHVSVKRDKECFVCQKDHDFWKCPEVMGMTASSWRNVCYKNKRCLLCSQPFQDPNHVRECSAKCRLCHGHHHMVMCEKNRFRTIKPTLKRNNEDQHTRKDPKRQKTQSETAEEEKRIQAAVNRALQQFKPQLEAKGNKGQPRPQGPAGGKGRGKKKQN
jgi:hypothetical protein